MRLTSKRLVRQCRRTAHLMKSYPQPEDVTSPKRNWSLIKVIYKGSPDDYSIAVGRWDNVPCLGIRWNACEERPVGNPQSRGLPTWFILPQPLEGAVLGTLDAGVREFARNFLK